MKAYLDLLRRVMDEGKLHHNRTGVDTRRVFGGRFEHDMSTGAFPALTTKRIFFKTVAAELIWFISGSDTVRPLQALGAHIWDANQADWEQKMRASGQWKTEWPDGYVGRAYGVQWRHWRTPGGGELDQLTNAIRMIREDPQSRRNIVTAWNPVDKDEVCLPPCHFCYQFTVDGDELSLVWTQRSCDLYLGVGFNVASYALLLELVARLTGKRPKWLVGEFHDLHIYETHFDQVAEQLRREPRPLPQLHIEDRGQKSIDDFVLSDIKLLNYDPHAALAAPMAV